MDLRCGWNMHDKNHRRLLDTIDELFKPRTALAAPECKRWSRSGNTSSVIARMSTALMWQSNSMP